MSTTTAKSIEDLQALLRRIGWPIPAPDRGQMTDATHRAISDFQRGFAWWRLLVDGFAGPKTERALSYCASHDGRCSLNFRFREWRSRGNGWIRLRRELVLGLEEVRELVGPIGVTSGYRDPAYNASLPGAASNSQHIYGNAIDPSKDLPLDLVRRLRRFSGIGIRASDRTIQHLDVRHLGPNTTGGTPADPTIWFYA